MGVSKLWSLGQILLPFHMWAMNGLYTFKWLEKKQKKEKNILFMWVLYEFKILAPTNRFYGNSRILSFTYCLWLFYFYNELTSGNETVWPVKPKIFIFMFVWLFYYHMLLIHKYLYLYMIFYRKYWPSC